MNTAYGFAYSAQGYNHIKANKVCQDSSGCYFDDDMVIIVVADGHGSNNYPRTNRGSKFAVEVTIAAVRSFVAGITEDDIDLSLKGDQYFEQLAKSILASWHSAVEADLAEHPFEVDELTDVKKNYGDRYLAGDRCERAYGTTLIAVCQTDTYWFGLQIGDGKCVCISYDGTVEEPIPWDEDCQANITTSICDTEAIDEFRYRYLPETPAATFIGTDGVDDSFAGDAELHLLYRAILAELAAAGREAGGYEIEKRLPIFSQNGSGDDVSMAGIVSSSLSLAFAAMIEAQCRLLNAVAQKEQADRQIAHTIEKHEYILNAMQKAKKSYESCIEKAADARAAVELAQLNADEAQDRLNAASAKLAAATATYQHSINREESGEPIASERASKIRRAPKRRIALGRKTRHRKYGRKTRF